LYDRINTRSYSPVKCPPSDALERAKEVLAEIESWPDDMDPDVQELRDILCDPHFRVSGFLSVSKYFRSSLVCVSSNMLTTFQFKDDLFSVVNKICPDKSKP
ncbi:uncharacterized protein TNCT_26021, partial [Trichonephila clavata]